MRMQFTITGHADSVEVDQKWYLKSIQSQSTLAINIAPR
jgi:hypothetical protein